MTNITNITRLWTAAIVIIGDEILSGRTQDKNTAQIAIWLNAQGIRLREVRVVADDKDAIAEAVNALRTRYDYLFTTGGIGPTHDDITVDAIAYALGVEVTIHPTARKILEEYYATRGGVTEERLRMARFPKGAKLIRNHKTGGPGIHIENIYIMAGVPHITAAMLETLNGTLQGGAPLVSQTIGAWAPESEVATLLREGEQRYAGVAIGSYPFFRKPDEPGPKYGANFVVRATDAKLVAECIEYLTKGLADMGYEAIADGVQP